MTLVLPASDDAICQAAEVLRAGGLVAFPTETVYGLGAAAENPRAVAAMFKAKGRPADHPVIVHLAAADELGRWAAEVPTAARSLAAAFWPGPLTMILRRSPLASDLVTGGLPTVGLRVPRHPVAQQLLRALGGAIAAPSANRFGRVSPTSAAHVLEELGGHIDLILDGGACSVGLESTIVDLTGNHPAVLRPGGISHEQVAEVLGTALAAKSAGAPRVSGSLESHYAPRARVELCSPEAVFDRAQFLVAGGERVAVLTSQAIAMHHPSQFAVIEMPASDEQFAQELYAALRQADAAGCDVILASLPPAEGMGAAIADRLSKAAGPRSIA
jgi:L-threonylcarbamoyladenylate synthase